MVYSDKVSDKEPKITSVLKFEYVQTPEHRQDACATTDGSWAELLAWSETAGRFRQQEILSVWLHTPRLESGAAEHAVQDCRRGFEGRRVRLPQLACSLAKA